MAMDGRVPVSESPRPLSRLVPEILVGLELWKAQEGAGRSVQTR